MSRNGLSALDSPRSSKLRRKQRATARFQPTAFELLENRIVLASSSLTVALATGTYGGTTNLSATLTSASVAVPGEVVDFHIGATDVGTATTNSSGVATLNNASIASINAGMYINDVTANFAGDPNFTASSGASDLNVTTAPLTITANNQTKVYGAALPTLTVSYTGLVNGDTSASLTTSPTITTTATSASHVAGNPYSITASAAVDSNYTISYVAGSLNVTTATLTITANNQTKVYGAALPTLTVSSTGLVNGDTSASLTTLPTVATTATSASHVGGSPFAITASNAADTDYTISYVAGSLNVTAAPLTIAANNQTKVYGTVVPTLTASYTGFVNGDTSASLSALPSLTTTATSASHVSGSPFAITASGAVDPDYTISYVAGNLNVTAAPLTITAVNKTKVYGQVNPPLTASYSGFVNGDTTASLSTLPTVSAAAGQYASVSNYPIQVSGAADANYSFSYVNGTLTVTPAPLVILIDNASKVYGQANPTFSGIINGILANDQVNATYATSATQYSDVQQGGYAITFVALTGPQASDYSTTVQGASVTPALLSVTPAPLSVSVADHTKTYGQPNPTAIGVFTGALNGDLIDLTYAHSATQYSDVISGGYAINPTGITGPKAADYSYLVQGASVTPGTLTVTPAPLAVVVSNQTKVYGQANPNLTGSVAGVLNNDDLSVNYGTAATPASDVQPGGYAIDAISLTGAKALDYTLNQMSPGSLTITPAPLVVSGNIQSKTYGQPNPVFTVSYSGFVLGQDPTVLGGSLTSTTVANTASHAGAYFVTPGGLTSNNYAISFINGGLAVNQANLAIVAPSPTKVYGQAVPTLTPSYYGFVNGDTPDSLASRATVTSTTSQASHVGTYPTTAGGAASADYTFTYSPGAISVTPATLTVNPNGVFKLFGVPLPALTASYSGFVNGDTPASLSSLVTLTTTANALSAPGFYPIIAQGGSSPDYHVVDGYNFVDVLALNAGQVAFVKSLYADILGRTPEATGLNFWVVALNQGTTRVSVASQIYKSGEAVTYRAHHRGHTVSQATALTHAQKAQAKASV